MCARGLSELPQPMLLQQHPHIHVEWMSISMENGTGPAMSSREVLLVFVQRGWQEQTVLPGVKGIGSGELRATAASQKKEFSLVTGVCW